MKHFAEPSFWHCLRHLPQSTQQLADKNFNLLKSDPKHPSLHLKRLSKDFWSVRVGKGYRALAVQMDDGNLTWFWIGTHAQYDKLVQ